MSDEVIRASRSKPPAMRRQALLTLLAAFTSVSVSSCDTADRVPPPRHEGSFITRALSTTDDRQLEIDRPSCGVFGPANQIAICEGAERQIVVLDSTGRKQWRFGRRGAGPGEFHTISGIHFDSAGRLHVFDGGRKKLVLISPSGELISDRVFHELTGWMPRSIGELTHGRIVLLQSTYAAPGVNASEGYQRVTTSVGVLDTTTRLVTTFDTATLSEHYAHGHGFRRVTFGLPYSASGSAVVVGNHLIRGFARDSFFVRRDLSTGATDTVWIDAPAFRLSSEAWEAKWNEQVAKSSPDFRPALISAANRVPRSDRHPRYVRLLATPAGTVAIYAPVSEEMEEYTIRCVITPHGEACPNVTTSDGEIVIAIASGRALIARETPDGSYRMELKVVEER